MTIISACLIAVLVFITVLLADQRGRQAGINKVMPTIDAQSATIVYQDSVLQQQSELIKTLERQRDEALTLTRGR